MKANEAPDKIYLEREKETNRIHHLWGRTPVISSLYEHIEYTRTDVIVERAVKYIANHFLAPGMDNEIEDFRKYMKGE